VTGPAALLAGAARRVRGIVVNAAGGPARARVVVILAAVLGLGGADTGTVTSNENNLEHAFHIGNAEIGILLSVVSLVGVLFAIPMGILIDRTNRLRLLTFSIALWAVAILFSGAATSFVWLLAARVGLGVVTATAAPAVASLTGDFFPAAERGRVYGLIPGGELIGYVISGDISSVLPWRFAFWWLIVPSLALAWAVRRLPEPARGGQSQLQPGAQVIPGARDAAKQGRPAAGRAEDEAQDSLAARETRRARVQPQPELVLRGDPTGYSIWWAIRYVLRVRTNVVLIVASAIGYFFFEGMDSFATIFAISLYGVSKPVATLLVVVVVGAGALAGVYAGGRFADRLGRPAGYHARPAVGTRRGHPDRAADPRRGRRPHFVRLHVAVRFRRPRVLRQRRHGRHRIRRDAEPGRSRRAGGHVPALPRPAGDRGAARAARPENLPARRGHRGGISGSDRRRRKSRRPRSRRGQPRPAGRPLTEQPRPARTARR
jgi:predicted MFS family arabinose efflux permease